MTPNLPHLHLLLNHVPTVGTVVGIALLATGRLRRDAGLIRAALEVLYGVALLTLPAYITGMASQQILSMTTDLAPDPMVRHHDAALLGSVLMLLVGFVAWLALWQMRRGVSSGSTTTTVLVLGLVTVAAMAQAASLGGEIRHPEIVDPAAGPPSPAWLTAASMGMLVQAYIWMWPALETLHFVGLAALFGVIVLVNLRLLGMLPGVPFPALHRLLPWAALGLFLNVVTGMMFVLATPDQYVENISMHAKLVLLVLAGANLLYLTESDGPYVVGAQDRVPALARTMAIVAVCLWVGVMYFGRMLPFIGGAF